MVRIAVTRKIPERGLGRLNAAADVVVWDGDLPPSREQLVSLAAGADGLLSLLTEPVDGALLDQLPTLRVVSNMAVGYDNIDVPACTARNVAVCTTPDVLTDTTADFAFALLLAAARKVHQSARSVLAGEWRTWEPLGFLGQDVSGRTIGIIGMGRIGAAVARRAHGFDMRIIYVNPTPVPEIEQRIGAVRVELATLLAESDFVSLHVPLTDETRGLISHDELRAMKPTSLLINTSRGPTVDTEALTSALRSGEIWAAALDVTDPEPLPADHPLLELDNALVAPHIASATYETRSQMSDLAAQNIIAVLNGQQPPRCLNPEVLGRDRL